MIRRQALLECIHRHLDSPTYGHSPLGEVVPRVAAEIRRNAHVSEIPIQIVALPAVASFVDGNANDEEQRIVCQAVMVDNSVLAEVIAAVRSSRQPVLELPPLAQALNDRLLAMMPTMNGIDLPARSVTATEESSLSLENSSQKNSAERLPANFDEALSRQLPELDRAASSPRGSVHSRSQSTRLPIYAAVFLAIAASLVVLAWFQSRDSIPSTVPVVVDRKPPNLPSELPSSEFEGASDRVAHSEPKPSPSLIAPTPPEPSVEPQPSTPMLDSPKPPQVADRSLPPAIANSPELSKPAQTAIAELKWTKIQGLLARRAGKEASGSLSEPEGWSGVETGSLERLVDPLQEPIQLVSLPSSRAESELNQGGRMLLGPDTGISLSRSTNDSSMRVRMDYGAFALVDLPAGSQWELFYEERAVARMRWQSDASVVLAATSLGVQAQIQGGTVAINDEVHRDQTLLIDATSVKTTSDRIARLPAWVTRPTESVPLPRNVLAQLSTSSNLNGALDGLIESLAKSSSPIDANRLTFLAGWRVSLAGSHLNQLADSPLPVMRQAAFQRLVQLPESDPRAGKLWRRMDGTLGGPVATGQMRAMMELARRGGTLSPDQIEQLLMGLDSPEFARRAMCDSLLRRFFGGGPIFDPAWTGQAHVRGIGQWRRFINANRP